VLDISLKNLI